LWQGIWGGFGSFREKKRKTSTRPSHGVSQKNTCIVVQGGLQGKRVLGEALSKGCTGGTIGGVGRWIPDPSMNRGNKRDTGAGVGQLMKMPLGGA